MRLLSAHIVTHIIAFTLSVVYWH